MKITKTRLKQIIKEELDKVLKEEGTRLERIKNAFDADQQAKLNDILSTRLMSDKTGAGTYGSENVSPLDSVIHQAINNEMSDEAIIGNLEDELEMDMDY